MDHNVLGLFSLSRSSFFCSVATSLIWIFSVIFVWWGRLYHVCHSRQERLRHNVQYRTTSLLHFGLLLYPLFQWLVVGWSWLWLWFLILKSWLVEVFLLVLGPFHNLFYSITLCFYLIISNTELFQRVISILQLFALFMTSCWTAWLSIDFSRSFTIFASWSARALADGFWVSGS